MKPTANEHPLVLPQALWAELEAAAVDECRAIEDVVRELIETGLSERRWKAHVAQERERARSIGFPDDDLPVTDEFRQSIRAKIAQGVRSLREGRAQTATVSWPRWMRSWPNWSGKAISETLRLSPEAQQDLKDIKARADSLLACCYY